VRWNHYFSRVPQTQKVTLVLADGSYADSPPLLLSNLTTKISLFTKPFNLLDDPRVDADLGTFDRIFLCYGADSVWFPGDIHLIKNGGEWFQALTRVSVPDWHPKRELVIQAFKDMNGAKIEAGDFGCLVLERLVVPFDVDTLPMFRKVADQRYANSKQATIVYPGGLSSWIEAAVDAMCAPGGKLLIGDTGVYQPSDEYFYGFINTQCHAQARLIDFEILELILNSRGYITKLWELSEFVAAYADKGLHHSDPSQLTSQFILEIGKET